jgi:hypothetical protein
MLFSSKSQEYVKLIYNDFNKCMLNREINQKSNSIETTFLKQLFKLIKQSEKYIQSAAIKKNIFKHNINIDAIKQIKFPTIYNSNFFPENIKKNIEETTTTLIEYNAVLDGRVINFYFYTHDNSNLPTNTLDIYINYMLMWIHILNLYGENKCSKFLNIFIFLTDFKKTVPSNNFTILSPQEVNTGFTIVCSKISEIVIYRKEEWFKVFLHETLHNFGFEFSTMRLSEFNNNISRLFPIQSKFNLFESYCETWARIINAVFCSYSILNNKDNINEFLSYTDFLLQIERVFSLYQANKILNYMGIKYENLFKNDKISIAARKHLYKEKANVFAYYIVTSILMNDYTKFLKWCNVNNFAIMKFNKTPRTLTSFYDFIKNNYDSEIYIKSLKCIQNINKKNNNNIKNDDILKNSLRMTILELD